MKIHLMTEKQKILLLRTVSLKATSLNTIENLREPQLLNLLLMHLIAIIHNCTNFSDNHRICSKCEKVLHQDTKHFIHDHEKYSR